MTPPLPFLFFPMEEPSRRLLCPWFPLFGGVGSDTLVQYAACPSLDDFLKLERGGHNSIPITLVGRVLHHVNIFFYIFL